MNTKYRDEFQDMCDIEWVQILDCTLTSITSPIHVLQFQNAPQPPSLLVHPSPQWEWVAPNGHLVDVSSWWALLVVAHHHSLVARPTPWSSHREEDHHNKRNTKKVNTKGSVSWKKSPGIWGISDTIEIELAVQRDLGTWLMSSGLKVHWSCRSFTIPISKNFCIKTFPNNFPMESTSKPRC